VNLAQVEGSWGQILHAVRQRNPLVEGALRTNCKPVEVYGDEIVIAFPYPFLRDKLGDPRRRAEIQDALAEVLGGSYQLKLVMESEHRPRPQAATPGPNSSPVTPPQAGPHPAGPRGSETQVSSQVEEASQAGVPSAAAPSPANPSPKAGAQEAQPPDPSPQAQAAADEVPKEISDWAEEHGAKARIIPK
jgi:hypothetical protein